MKNRKTSQNAALHEAVASRGGNVANDRIVLVATYKGEQLTKWRGWYNNALEAA